MDDPFTAMAARIDLNKDQGFAGAFVIQPPGDDPPLSLLLLNNEPDPAVFWGTLSTYVQAALTRLAQPQGYR